MSESEFHYQQTQNSSEGTLPDTPADTLAEFPFFCNSFNSPDSFPSLTIDIPHVLPHDGNLPSVASFRSNGEEDLPAPVLDSDHLNFATSMPSHEDFFHHLNNSTSSYADQEPNCYIKNEYPSLLNLDCNLPQSLEAFNSNFDFVNSTNNCQFGDVYDPSNRKSVLFSYGPPPPLPDTCFPVGFTGSVNSAAGSSCIQNSYAHTVDWPNSLAISGDYSYDKNYSKYYWPLSTKANVSSSLPSTSTDSGYPYPPCPSVASTIVDLPESSHENAPCQWSEIGGASVLFRSLPLESKESLSQMRVPDEARKRKFLTVREMLNIKKKLMRAHVKSILHDSMSEDSMDEYCPVPSPSPNEDSAFNLLDDSADEPVLKKSRKMKNGRSNKRPTKTNRRNTHRQPQQLSDDESICCSLNSTDSQRLTSTPVSGYAPATPNASITSRAPVRRVLMHDGETSSLTADENCVPLPANESTDCDVVATNRTTASGSVSPRSQQVFDTVYSSVQEHQVRRDFIRH